ncbi:hypothetical protein GALMADRAFT_225517 [Galerina marginata CBS 339.88]|uniref:Uncharacterized protein n=1 Tax=Galerina marginata (strain CBS 339.88) TaxID=685588 RepID=A0A067T2E8_GALM3|nr:hypothetical protein GALMADRAFT_225517 [Galerina marginata CBS 339.88]
MNPMNPASGQVVGSTPDRARWTWTRARPVQCSRAPFERHGQLVEALKEGLLTVRDVEAEV